MCKRRSKLPPPPSAVPDGFSIQIGGENLRVIVLPAEVASILQRLTTAEFEVLGLLLDGMSNSRIAERRRTRLRTASNQVSSVLRKLEVTSRHELVLKVRGALPVPRRKA